MIKKLFISIVAFVGGIAIGLVLIQSGIKNSNGDIGAMIFSIVGGFILLVGGVAIGFLMKPKFFSFKYMFQVMKKPVLQDDPANDDDQTKKLLTSFRETFKTFIRDNKLQENSPLQNVATQIYWNICQMRLNRLIKKQIICDFESARNTKDENSVREDVFFDGKYEIRDVVEDISARYNYFSPKGHIFCRSYNQVAHWTLINAKKTSDNQIICPSCGKSSSRENLLDGCDYCGTKFTVEDLGMRVADFALRNDYETQYRKYKQARKTISKNIAIFHGVIGFIIGFIDGLRVACEKFRAGEGFFHSAEALILSSAFMSFVLCLYGSLFFKIFIFPFIHIGATADYCLKKFIDSMKNDDEKNNRVAEQIRKFDPLFSLSGFFSSVQNKISAIIYASNEQQINIFAECDLSSNLEKYQDIIDIGIDRMLLTDYKVDNDKQIASVTVYLSLLKECRHKAKIVRQKVNLILEKSSACKTQAVCCPTILRCKGCGSSLSLLQGKTCPICNTDINFRDFDWIIVEYNIN